MSAVDGHDEMQAFAASGLHKAFEPQLLQEFPHLPCAVDHLAPQHFRVRVQIEDQSIRVLQVVRSRAPGMDFQGADLG